MNVSSVQQARRRAIFTLCAAIGGITIADALPTIGSALWFSIACGSVAVSILVRGRFKSWTMIIALMMIAGGWMQMRTHEPAHHRLDQIVGAVGAADQRAPIEVTGVLVEPVRTQFIEPSPGDPPTWPATKTGTILNVDQVYMSDSSGRGTWVDASGSLRIVLPDGINEFAMENTDQAQRALRAGDRVKILGMYKPGGRARNFGDLDWDSLAAQSGRVGTMVVGDASMIHHIEHSGVLNRLGSRVVVWRAMIRTRAMRAIGLESQENLSRRAMLGALLLGQRDPAFGEVYSSFQRVGVAHVLAISGFHLALVILLAVVCVRFIGEHARIESLIIMTVLVLGILVIPMRPPIVRAGVIVIALLFANSVGRRYDRLTILMWVGVGLLVWRPMDAFSLGYQLSMGITGLLVILANNKQTAVGDNSDVPRFGSEKPTGLFLKSRGIVFDTFKVNLGCWMVAVPPIMYHAGIVSLLAPLVSMALIPLVMLLMFIGYLQIALGVAWPELAEHTIVALDWIAGLVGAFMVWVDDLPGSWIRMNSVGVLWALIATGVMAGIVTGRFRVRSWKTIAACGLLVIWVIAEPMMLRERSQLRIDMLDIGDGSCVIVQSQGEGLLWDCGSLDRRIGMQAGRAARELGLRTIRDAIVTHDNLDHFNGVIEIAPMVGLKRVWITRRMIDEPSDAWRATESRIRAMGIEIRELLKGESISLGGVELVCIWPDPSKIEGMKDNDTSAVMRVDVPILDADHDQSSTNHSQQRTVLLTGDIEREAMEQIIVANNDLQADIIELPHHGSAKPGADDFVRLINPKVIVQSTGSSRLNDSRWDDVRRGCVWYATADRGGVWVRVSREGAITHGWANPD